MIPELYDFPSEILQDNYTSKFVDNRLPLGRLHQFYTAINNIQYKSRVRSIQELLDNNNYITEYPPPSVSEADKKAIKYIGIE